MAHIGDTVGLLVVCTLVAYMFALRACGWQEIMVNNQVTGLMVGSGQVTLEEYCPRSIRRSLLLAGKENKA